MKRVIVFVSNYSSECETQGLVGPQTRVHVTKLTLGQECGVVDLVLISLIST